MRPLLVVDVSDPRALIEPLNNALFHDGPAVLPRPGGARVTQTAPLEVPDDIAVVIETSGTTGAPKRVALSARAVIASAEAANAALGGGGQWLLVLPAHYIAGLQVITRSLLASTTPVVLHPEPFSSVAIAHHANELLELSSEQELFTALVPAQLQRILDDASSMPVLDSLMQRFSRVLVGGQSIPEHLLARSVERGYRITRTYGSSETAGGCVWDQRPIGDTQVSVIDGRLAIGGSVIAEGYLEDPSRTAASFIEREGARWYLTDDQGSVGADGLVSVHGRLDDVIVSGGVKVSLLAIEKALQAELGVTDVIAVGVPSERWGESPVVVSTKALDVVRVRLIIQKALGPEARPERVVTVSEIPTLSTGKTDRQAVQALVREGS